MMDEENYISDHDSEIVCKQDKASVNSKLLSAKEGALDSQTRTSECSAIEIAMLSNMESTDGHIERRMRFDGLEVDMVTLHTQTDWDWVHSFQEPEQCEVVLADEASTGFLSSATSSFMSTNVQPESCTTTTSRPRTVAGNRSTITSRTGTDYTPFSLQPNDEFGIPLLELSSSSDDNSDEDTSMNNEHQPTFLSSVGPPQILKYIGESQLPNLALEHHMLDSKGNLVEFQAHKLDNGELAKGCSDMCEFCNKPLHPLSLSDLQADLDGTSAYCCDEYKEFVRFATDTALRMEQEAHKTTKTINIKPQHDSVATQERRAAKGRAMERMRQRELGRRQWENRGSQSHLPSSASTVPAMTSEHSISPIEAKGKPIVTRNARQIKTINYQLSSKRCLDEGWTLRCPSSLDMENEEAAAFAPDSTCPDLIHSGIVCGRKLIEKFYPNGTKFLTMFPDGSGNIFYPSGHLAIIIVSNLSAGQHTYIVHSDCPPQATVLAVFDQNAFGSVYFGNGNIMYLLDRFTQVPARSGDSSVCMFWSYRLHYDWHGGLELDRAGSRRRRWLWATSDTHVHAPPLQPLYLRLNDHVGVRVVNRDAVAVTFAAGCRSCRLSVGVKAKIPVLKAEPRLDTDQYHVFIDECTARVEYILSKVALLLKYPRSPNVDKILPPIHVTANLNRAAKSHRRLKTSLKPINVLMSPKASRGFTSHVSLIVN